MDKYLTNVAAFYSNKPTVPLPGELLSFFPSSQWPAIALKPSTSAGSDGVFVAETKHSRPILLSIGNAFYSKRVTEEDVEKQEFKTELDNQYMKKKKTHSEEKQEKQETNQQEPATKKLKIAAHGT